MRDYSQYLLNTHKNGTRVWLRCLTATAEFYGWDKSFDVFGPKVAREEGEMVFGSDPGRVGDAHRGGKRLYICRSPKRQGQPRGKTNSFRVQCNCSNRDLAELAYFTKGEWHWMEGLYGARRTKAHWLEMYEAA